MHIPLRAPFDFTHTLAFLRAFSPMAGEQRITRDTLVKSWIVCGTPVTVSMKQQGERLACALDVRLDGAAAATLRDRVAAFVGADEDLTELYALAARDERFAPVADELRGFHHPKFATPFEAACWSVINQRVQLAQARRMKAAIVARWGAGGCDAFPEAQTLARATEKEIGWVIGNERKARAVWSVAQAFRDVDERWLQTAPLADVDAWLRRIWGVGDFASGFILYRGLGRARSLPWSDKFVRAARKTYPGADRAALERRGKHYGPWMGHWALYLWAHGRALRPAGRVPRPAWRASDGHLEPTGDDEPEQEHSRAPLEAPPRGTCPDAMFAWRAPSLRDVPRSSRIGS